MPRGSIYSLVVVDDRGEKHLIRFKEIHTGNVSEKALLAQIDAVTSNCADMAEFMSLLNKQVHFTYTPVKCFIEYEVSSKNDQGITERQKKKKDLIFNNQLILRASYNLLRRKAHGEKNIDDKLPAVTATLKELKVRAMQKDNEEYVLAHVPYAIKERLDEYLKAVRSDSLEYYRELQSIDASLRGRLCTYSNFRDTQLVLREVDRREAKEKTRESIIAEMAKQITILDFIEQAKIKESDMSEYNKDLEENEEELREIQEEKERRIKALDSTPENEYNFIEDPYVKELYIETSGDIDAIKEALGEEKLVSLSENDKIILGINLGYDR